jgi:hypothetical protein
MNVCIEIKRRIDEADQPDQLNLEISRHTAHCFDCRAFADERAGLRNLLASGARVSVPMNFDAALRARLAEVKTQKSFSWFSPAGYLRLGAATAALAMLVFAAQTSDIFSSSPLALKAASVSPFPSESIAGNWKASDFIASDATVQPGASASSAYATVSISRGLRYGVGQGRRVAVASPAPEDYVSLDDGGVILVRGQNGERAVTVSTVSVGAQPLLYSSRPSQPTRNISVSF